MIRINQLKVLIGSETCNDEKIRKKIIRKLKLKPGQNFTYEIVKRSIDARKKPDIFYNYVIDVKCEIIRSGKITTSPSKNGFKNEEQEKYEIKLVNGLKDSTVIIQKPFEYNFPYQFSLKSHINYSVTVKRPVIIGTGPAGLLCGYMLAAAGLRPILLERGEAVDDREKTVERFWQEGILNPESNVQFGEGGAGTFSDGKLNTQIKDKDGIKRAVLSIFIDAGAPSEILFEQKPHLGTDVLKNIVKKLRNKIIKNGGEVRFGQKVTGFLVNNDIGIETEIKSKPHKVTGVIINGKVELLADQIILAIGHSARDTFEILYDAGVKMEAKPFAVGLRVEHPQVLVNQAQYAVTAHELLGAADYKLVSKSKAPSLFSFCMCPGGFIVNASSEEGRLVTNGMSYRDRAGNKANSAIVMTVKPDDFPDVHPLSGIKYQRQLEERTYQIGNGKIPVAYLRDFREAVNDSTSKEKLIRQSNFFAPDILPDTKGVFNFAPVHKILDGNYNKAFLSAMSEFGHQIPGFDDDYTLIAGIESRTSSPVRILRDDTFQSNITGLYPCGEGAGYAGGIMSAAIDGVRIAEAVAKRQLRI